jgi:hypothetical protein
LFRALAALAVPQVAGSTQHSDRGDGLFILDPRHEASRQAHRQAHGPAEPDGAPLGIAVGHATGIIRCDFFQLERQTSNAEALRERAICLHDLQRRLEFVAVDAAMLRTSGEQELHRPRSMVLRSLRWRLDAFGAVDLAASGFLGTSFAAGIAHGPISIAAANAKHMAPRISRTAPMQPNLTSARHGMP